MYYIKVFCQSLKPNNQILGPIRNKLNAEDLCEIWSKLDTEGGMYSVIEEDEAADCFESYAIPLLEKYFENDH